MLAAHPPALGSACRLLSPQNEFSLWGPRGALFRNQSPPFTHFPQMSIPWRRGETVGVFPPPASGLFTRSSSELALSLRGWASRRHLSWKQEAVNLVRRKRRKAPQALSLKADLWVQAASRSDLGPLLPQLPRTGGSGSGGVPRAEVGAWAWRRPGFSGLEPLLGLGFPIRTSRGGWGHWAQSRTKPGDSPALQLVPLAWGPCPSLCGFAGCCHVRPQSGASRGAGGRGPRVSTHWCRAGEQMGTRIGGSEGT